MAEAGHNVGGIAGDRLRAFIERVERLEEEKRTIASDIKEVYAEAKGNGFDTKIMRQLVKERQRDKDDLDEEQTLLEIYRKALGDYISASWLSNKRGYEHGTRFDTQINKS